MSLATVFNRLGQTVIPGVAAAAFPDTLTVETPTLTSDNAGGFYPSATVSTYTNIPCAYEPQGGGKTDANGKLLSVENYKVTMPTHYSLAGVPTRINLNPTRQRLVITARGNEPAKTMRMMSIADDMGVCFEVFCQREG
jgi:hypothetical protein